MRVYQGMTFADTVGRLLEDFSTVALPVDVGQWQGLDIKGDASKVTWELRESILQLRMPETMESAQVDIRPNLPWAEDHFNERISGEPLNPPPSQAWWPFAQQGHADHLKRGKFSHTYPERFWPKWEKGDSDRPFSPPRRGIRFEYGDLDDVITRMTKNPYTRQAYLPIWFPEDTGAPDGERVPCTLGYLFMVRDGKLHVTYHIRACDFMRHFRDDVYLAIRLGHFVRECIAVDVAMGDLTMHISSFHIFGGDRAMVEHLRRQATIERSVRLREALG
jgi:thymidylate synthase